jgi:hypothetical protein
MESIGRPALALFVAWFFFVSPCNSSAQQTDSETVPETNLNVMRSLAETIGFRVGESIGTAGADSAGLLVHPQETAWYVEGSLIRGLTKSGIKIIGFGHGVAEIELALGALEVQYSDPWKSGFLGASLVERAITVSISSLVRFRTPGESTAVEDMVEAFKDTIELDQITMLENPNIPATRGTIPEEGFFTNPAEPLIMLGAIAVAVFLLFHVRS